jgi:hypothetical protein
MLRATVLLLALASSSAEEPSCEAAPAGATYASDPAGYFPTEFPRGARPRRPRRDA